jgi:predicted transcriptional regulator
MFLTGIFILEYWLSLIDPKQLKRIRNQIGYTQTAGLSQSIIAKIEAGSVDPTFSTLATIPGALNANVTTKGKKAGDVMTSPAKGGRTGRAFRSASE